MVCLKAATGKSSGECRRIAGLGSPRVPMPGLFRARASKPVRRPNSLRRVICLDIATGRRLWFCDTAMRSWTGRRLMRLGSTSAQHGTLFAPIERRAAGVEANLGSGIVASPTCSTDRLRGGHRRRVFVSIRPDGRYYLSRSRRAHKAKPKWYLA